MLLMMMINTVRARPRARTARREFGGSFPRPPYSRVPVHTLYCSSVTSRPEKSTDGVECTAKPALRTEEDRRAVEDHIRSIGKQFA